MTSVQDDRRGPVYRSQRIGKVAEAIASLHLVGARDPKLPIRLVIVDADLRNAVLAASIPRTVVAEANDRSR
jgi:hypothetical protein